MSIFLVLDWDGTIFERSKHMLYNLPSYFKLLLKYTIPSSLKNYGIYGLNPKNMVKEFLRKEKLEVGNIERYVDKGFLELLHIASKKNIPIYIVSTSNKKVIEDYIEICKNALEKNNLKIQIEVIASTDDEDISPKKKGKIVEEIKRYGKVIYVGDSYTDLYASQSADLSFLRKTLVYYLSPRKPKCRAKIRKLKELANLLYNIKPNNYIPHPIYASAEIAICLQ
ncbi:MAG: HAD family hydrolase [Candidatus Aenigmatarchaeota archaeon]